MSTLLKTNQKVFWRVSGFLSRTRQVSMEVEATSPIDAVSEFLSRMVEDVEVTGVVRK